MLKLRTFLLFQIFFLLMPSCSEEELDEETLGNWTKVSPFKGRPRSGAITFTIDSRTFVGLGYNGDEYLQDVYSYDVNEGFWEARTAFPGVLRERAVSFSLDGKGYIGLGYNRELDDEELNDFWEYDPATDTWTQLPDFGGSARYSAVSFSVGSKAYVGTGFDGSGYTSDFWEFDYYSRTWSEIQSYPGEKIERGVAFVIGDKGYVCSGRNNGIHNLDFWEFQPEAGAWTRLSPSSDHEDYEDFKLAVQRHDAVAFTMDSKAYIIGGISSSGASAKTIYEFDPATGDWNEKTPFEGSARSLPSAFVLNGRAFVGTGQNGSNFYDDIWEFKPLQDYDEEN